VRVLTCDVQARVRSVPDQARALAAADADVVALQEVRGPLASVACHEDHESLHTLLQRGA